MFFTYIDLKGILIVTQNVCNAIIYGSKFSDRTDNFYYLTRCHLYGSILQCFRFRDEGQLRGDPFVNHIFILIEFG